MPPDDAFELRDADGTFVVARPLGRTRCRVILSNAFAAGDILRKAEPFSWTEAAAEGPEGTRLSPHDLEREPEEDASGELPGDDDVFLEAHLEVERRSRIPRAPGRARKASRAA
jgi:hypothetical protein